MMSSSIERSRVAAGRSGSVPHVALAALALLAMPAAGDVMSSDNDEFTLGEILRFPVSESPDPGAWFRQTGSSLAISSGGHARDGLELSAMPNSSDKDGDVVYRLAESSIGRAVSELQPDFTIGEYCTLLPTDPMGINWKATAAAITNSAAYRDGYVFYIDSATNDFQRVLFTRGGSLTIPWVLADNSTKELAYTIASSCNSRPYRIFWTEEPFNAPKIDLSGKFVRLLGNPDIITPEVQVQEISTSPYNALTNIVRGVVFDQDSDTLRAYARVIDSATDQYDGPEGQFVLAYYDTGARDRFLGSVVVEVSGPDVTTLSASVGDRLWPSGGGYGIEGLQPYIQKGVAPVASDPNSPYLEQFSSGTNTNKDGAVYAIAPTDATASSVDSGWKADIYWEAPDFMDTLWPFEESWYVIGWGRDDPLLVTGDAGSPGEGVFIPSAYTASICAYSSPRALASVSSNEVVAAGEGRFTLKLITDDDVWYVPFRAVLHTNTNFFDLTVADWTVCDEVAPRSDAAAGSASEAASRVDPDLPGYIYESASGARNWNELLYHRPSASPGPTNTVALTDEEKWAGVPSGIFLVNASDKPVEVWWRAEILLDGMGEALTYPANPQRYRAAWPGSDDAHEIVLSSELGSAGRSFTCGGSAMFLADTGSSALASDVPVSADDGFAVAFWLNPSPKAAGNPPPQSGGVVALEGGGSQRLQFMFNQGVESTLSVGFGALSNSVPTFAFDPLTVSQDEWMHIGLSVSPATKSSSGSVASLYANAELVGSFELGCEYVASFCSKELDVKFGDEAGSSDGASGAAGLAVDAFMMWSHALDQEEIALSRTLDDGSTIVESTLAARYDFDDSSDLVHIAGFPFRFASDEAAGGALIATNCLSMSPGAPKPTDGIIPDSAVVQPSVYRQNDRGRVGYNPNEEHAFLRQSPVDGSWTAWAMRNDLNNKPNASSDPFVLVQYVDESGAPAMRAFEVVTTNEYYPAFFKTNTVGQMMAGPHPFDTLAGDYNRHGRFSSTNDADDSAIAYYDKYGRAWARRDGTGLEFNSYATLDTFDFPSLKADEVPAPGTLIGWMNCVRNENPARSDIVGGTPLPWKWECAWPPDDKVPTMRIGQTLTTADSALPEVWSAMSMAVAYPAPVGSAARSSRSVVKLIDPTVARTAPLAIDQNFADEYGFTVGSSGNCMLRAGKYYFQNLPPTIADRFYIDTNAEESKRMVLVGKLVDKPTGTKYLELNTLTAAERSELRDLCKSEDADRLSAWRKAVDSLAVEDREPNEQSVSSYVVRVASDGESRDLYVPVVSNAYSAVDHYALFATGAGAGHVVLIENDNPDTDVVPSGNSVSMHVINVVSNLYAGGLVAIEDPMNKLSQELTIYYTAPLGESSTNFVFQWRRREPPSDGSVPADYPQWPEYADDAGLVSVLLGADGATLSELVNTYYVMRYRAVEGTPAYETTGGAWSDWCGPTLAEGWVQRVLSSVTPFAQRVEDFYNQPTDLMWLMTEQIGGPWHGDVALNNDNLATVGLIELYQTVLNKAESMSLSVGINDSAANKQLMEAVSRLADLYILLGDDAYSDANNPTVAAHDIMGSSSSDVFCFANQVPTLLDEELALLRGRTSAVAPNMTTYPYYNRLMWNFTKGITEGEVAYVNNYNVGGEAGIINEDAAADMYPMGHGDAYGHYLSAIWGYYRLLRNPSFSWGDPSMMEMLIAQSIVNMDYEDEQKFATAAAKLAQTGAEVIDLTVRKTWRDQGGDTRAGYFDEDAEQAFGYGEWATRVGIGALVNWATVNSLLPASTNDSVRYFADDSIKEITRSTVTALPALASKLSAVESSVNRLDAGLNPLGIADGAVPLDIDPIELALHDSHFDQMLARTEVALSNAWKCLDYAQDYGSRQRALTDAEGAADPEYANMESSYNTQLIGIYGTPYPGDIGAGGTYEQGYSGPDLYHYMWLDTGEYGISALSTSQSVDVVTYSTGVTGGVPTLYSDLDVKVGAVYPVRYTISSGGVIVKPDSVTGKRACEGSIQEKMREFLLRYNKVQQVLTIYNAKVNSLLKFDESHASAKFGIAQTRLALDEAKVLTESTVQVVKSTADILSAGLDWEEALSSGALHAIEASVPTIIGAGLTVNTDPHAIAAGSVAAVNAVNATTVEGLRTASKSIVSAAEIAQALETAVRESIYNGFDYYDAIAEVRLDLLEAVATVRNTAYELQNALSELAAAEAAYRTEIAKGQALLEERALIRQQQSNNGTAQRYNDMFLRVWINNALSRYHASFDIAQRYVFMLAQAYDYETGLLSSDSQAGDAFKREIIACRALGDPRTGAGESSAGTDGGLYEIVARMKANWAVLKGRLGVNNPENTTRSFSLRWSLFRIDPGPRGDAAWRRELEKYRVDDILSDPEFRHYCQRPQAQDGPVAAEPGFIIPFSTSIDFARNFFGKPLLGDESAYSSSDYATKIHSIGVKFVGYNSMTTNASEGCGPQLALSPNIYLVPAGRDYMRAPAGIERKLLAFDTVDQVMPLPYAVGSTELDSASWQPTMEGLDGTTATGVRIRRHSTIPEGGSISSTRLVGRSVWNDRWLLVIPAGSMHSDRAKALDVFLDGADTDGDGVLDQKPVSDILLGIRAYSRSGN